MTKQPTSWIQELAWPGTRMGEAIAALGRVSKLIEPEYELSNPVNEVINNPEKLQEWLQRSTVRLGLEVLPVHSNYQNIKRDLCVSVPAIIQVTENQQHYFLVIMGCSLNKLVVLSPNLQRKRLPVEWLSRRLCEPLESPYQEQIQQAIDAADIPERKIKNARTELFKQQLDQAPIDGMWIFRLPAHCSIWRQFRFVSLQKQLAGLVCTHTIYYLMWIASWGVLGNAALQGRVDRGWIIAWVLLLITMVPFRLGVTWFQGILAINAGAILKQRLLAGAMALKADTTRHMGIGQLFGRVVETEELESLTLNGGVLSIVALVELIFASLVLAMGAAGVFHVLLVLLTVSGISYVVYKNYQHTWRWTQSRLGLTHNLVEGMVGYRTRLAQEQPDSMHNGDDERVAINLDHARLMDRSSMWLNITPRAWLMIGVLALGPAFVFANVTTVELAIGLGGVLLCYRAIIALSSGANALIRAMISWQQLQPLLDSTNNVEAPGDPNLLLPATQSSEAPTSNKSGSLIEARDIGYKYESRNKAVLADCNLSISKGDKVLLQGESGGGKSTLSALITGIRQPTAGLLLLHGFDYQTIGSYAWRRRIVCAPQFHENHVFMGPFAFNVLMGKRWPPTYEDVQQADEVCRELGLGDLLDRMPGGILQMVGDTGWQLSHGERSRMYIARALLQDADMLVFDESFAALDPDNLQRALQYVSKKASTILVIAHP